MRNYLKEIEEICGEFRLPQNKEQQKKCDLIYEDIKNNEINDRLYILSVLKYLELIWVKEIWFIKYKYIFNNSDFWSERHYCDIPICTLNYRHDNYIYFINALLSLENLPTNPADDVMKLLIIQHLR